MSYAECANCDARFSSRAEIDAAGTPPNPPMPLRDDEAHRVLFELDLQDEKRTRPACPRCGQKTIKPPRP